MDEAFELDQFAKAKKLFPKLGSKFRTFATDVQAAFKDHKEKFKDYDVMYLANQHSLSQKRDLLDLIHSKFFKILLKNLTTFLALKK